ncbi:MAG TPA: protein phosphatase 2C domain-containing protein [Methylomirabilota bacterium]|nr:protein phosphatase 2C domain-containing protein [Methylomirabilota bacterium]
MSTLATRPSGVGGLLATLWRRGLRRERMVRAAGASDPGRVRLNNEDCFVMADLVEPARTVWSDGEAAALASSRPLLVVADGMGGAAGGEIGSAMAGTIICGQMQDAVRERRLRTAWQWRKTLIEAFDVANRRIHDRARHDAALNGMGTTATAAAIARDVLYVAHIGDSRAYLVRDGKATRLTRDHTWLQYIRDAGRSADLSADDPRRNALLKALGTGRELTADFFHTPVRPHDTVVLCTDGLWSAVDDGELARLAAAHDDLAALCETLLGLASERGGQDNATAVVARVGEP